MRDTPKQVLNSSAARAILATAVVMLCVSAAPDALGCPNCKDAVNTSDPQGLAVARGYFYSILIMLAMPFTLVSSFGIYVWRETRRQRQALDGVAEQQPSDGRQGIVSPPTAAVP